MNPIITRTFVRAFLFSILASASFPALATPVGATPGSFSVDPNGGANYTVPIVILPGTGGMVPSIALSYSKSVDNSPGRCRLLHFWFIDHPPLRQDLTLFAGWGSNE